jgi:hypothetical protein
MLGTQGQVLALGEAEHRAQFRRHVEGNNGSLGGVGLDAADTQFVEKCGHVC